MVMVKSQPKGTSAKNAAERGLGRGLSALISEQKSAAVGIPADDEAAPEKAEGEGKSGIRNLYMFSISPGKFQPRSRFDESQLRELSESIRRNGIMQPIVVRRLPGQQEGDKAAFEIVAGERRWRAAQMAGMDTIPCIVRDLSDQQALELGLIENVQRADLNPLEEAGGYQRLLAEFGYTQEELAQVVGKSRSHIANLLRLLNLPPEVRVLLEEGRISMGHARALLSLPDQEAALAARAIAERGLSVRQAETLARNTQGIARQPRPRGASSTNAASAAAAGPKDPDILALEETISGSLGMTVTIADTGDQSGEIIIRYGTLSELDHALRLLGGGM